MKKAVIGKENTKTIVLFCAICVITASVVMTIFYAARAHESDTNTYSMSKEIETEVEEELGCSYWQLVGDQFCDDEANTAECQFDSGDCCDYLNDFSLCQDCICYSQSYANDTKCLDSLIYDPKTWYLGDGKCQLELNHIEHFFDAGDCCLENPECQTFIEGENEVGMKVWKLLDIACPQNVCIKSDIFCIRDQMGDGICDDTNNSILCDFDLGDCCGPDTIKGFCCFCSCLPLSVTR